MVGHNYWYFTGCVYFILCKTPTLSKVWETFKCYVILDCHTEVDLTLCMLLVQFEIGLCHHFPNTNYLHEENCTCKSASHDHTDRIPAQKMINSPLYWYECSNNNRYLPHSWWINCTVSYCYQSLSSGGARMSQEHSFSFTFFFNSVWFDSGQESTNSTFPK